MGIVQRSLLVHGFYFCAIAAGVRASAQPPVDKSSKWYRREDKSQAWVDHTLWMYRHHSGAFVDNELSLLRYVQHSEQQFVAWLGKNDWTSRSVHGYTTLHAVCESNLLCEGSLALIRLIVEKRSCEGGLGMATADESTLRQNLLCSNTMCTIGALTHLVDMDFYTFAYVKDHDGFTGLHRLCLNTSIINGCEQMIEARKAVLVAQNLNNRIRRAMLKQLRGASLNVHLTDSRHHIPRLSVMLRESQQKLDQSEQAKTHAEDHSLLMYLTGLGTTQLDLVPWLLEHISPANGAVVCILGMLEPWHWVPYTKRHHVAALKHVVYACVGALDNITGPRRAQSRLARNTMDVANSVHSATPVVPNDVTALAENHLRMMFAFIDAVSIDCL